MITTLETTLKEVKGRQAVLGLADGQTLMVPAESVVGAQVGDAFSIQILPAEDAAKSQQELARTVLTELMAADA